MADLLAGVARRDITPRPGVELCGYGPFLRRAATAVHDPLFCRALVLERDGTQIVLVACDIIGVLQATTDQVRAELQQRFGIAPENVMITCTHTHGGPNTIHLIGWGEPDAEYRAALPKLIIETVEAALHAMTPVHIGFGRTLVEGVARNRVQTDGTGLLDPEINLIRLDTADGSRMKALVVQYSCHPVVLGSKNTLITGDYAGEAERRLEAMPDGPEVALFLNGTLGDINSSTAVQTGDDAFAAVAQLGGIVAEAARAGVEGVPLHDDVPLRGVRTHLDLPLQLPSRSELDGIRELLARAGELEGIDGQIPADKAWANVAGVNSVRFNLVWARHTRQRLDDRAPLARPIELQALRIGEAGLVGLPGEVFVVHGFAIKQRSPFRQTLPIGLANDSVGYIPRAHDYTQGPGNYGYYAATLAPRILDSYPFAPNVGQVLIDGSIEALERLD